jgi:DNA modification methylase
MGIDMNPPLNMNHDLKTILNAIFELKLTDSESKKTWKDLLSTYSKKELQSAMIDVALVHPYPEVIVEDEKALKDLDSLINLDPTKEVIKQGNWNCDDMLVLQPQNTRLKPSIHGMQFSKKFNWLQRAKTSTKGKIAPADTWTKEELTKHVERFWTYYRRPCYPSKTYWRTFINLKVALVSQFRPAVAKTIYTMFSADHILDLSAGWGDRLTAAIATSSVKSYTGIDPSPHQHEIYKNIIEYIKKHRPHLLINKDIQLIQGCSEDCDLQRDYYDLMFTSPPYFNTELYIGGIQSHSKYKTYTSWFKDFLIPSFMNAVNSVKKGGHIVINCKNYNTNAIASDLVKFSNTISCLVYIGSLGMIGASNMNNIDKDKAEPIMVWQKK